MLDININNRFNIGRIFDFARKNQSSKSVPVVKRINALLESHDLKRPQLLGLVPKDWEWTLANIMDDDRLLSSISNEVLDWFASTFDINRAWLEGASDQIHNYIWGYKNLPEFFREISELGWTGPELRMAILAEHYCTKYPFLHRYAIVFSLPAIEIESTDRTIYKHRLFETVWDYHYPPCVKDTKAVARWFTKRDTCIRPIPIIPVKSKLFQSITESRTLITHVWTDHIGGFDRFEDRVLYDFESCCAKETESMDGIVEYLESATS